MAEWHTVEHVREDHAFFVIEFYYGAKKEYADRREVSGNRFRRRGTWHGVDTPHAAARFETEDNARREARRFLKSNYATSFRNIKRVRVIAVRHVLLDRTTLTDGPEIITPGLPLIDKVGALDTPETK